MFCLGSDPAKHALRFRFIVHGPKTDEINGRLLMDFTGQRISPKCGSIDFGGTTPILHYKHVLCWIAGLDTGDGHCSKCLDTRH